MIPYGFFFLTYLIYVFIISPKNVRIGEEKNQQEEASNTIGHRYIQEIDLAFNVLLIGFSSFLLFNEIV